MTEAGWTVCIECGMMCEAVEYHPYAACLMFKQCLNSETVRANLQAVRDDSYQHGRAAGARECVEKVRARAALWRAHGGAKIGFPYGHLTVEGECDSIADELGKFAQQAQDEKGVGNANIKMS